MKTPRNATALSRRHLLAGLAVSSVLLPLGATAAALAAADLGVRADVPDDQTAALQAAMAVALQQGTALALPAGTISVANLVIPASMVLEGVPGRTVLAGFGGQPIASINNASDIVLRTIGFGVDTGGSGPLLYIAASDRVTVDGCSFAKGADIALSIYDSAVTIGNCSFSDHPDAAIHAVDSRGLVIVNNRIARCGNAGIRIWRNQPGADGTIITGNHIADIDWRGGGSGQNGNGINVFNADAVIIAANHISGCAFTAVRLNTTNNTQVSGNTCLDSGEIAIYSEFSFSGSVIANNIVDGAATGISITNMNNGGQIAVCSGNIVRNIAPASAVNPDATPIGIAAEAEVAITGNTVANVPGIAFAAGYGTYLRNVLIASNIAYAVRIGIGVSVVDGAGPVHIANNMISDPLDHAMVGLAWSEIVETDLAANVARYPNVTIS